MKYLRSKPYLCIWVSGFLLCMIYMSLAFNNSIWTDEAYTLWLIKGNFSAIISGTAKDVHPPLYYLLARVVYVIFHGKFLLFFQKLLVILPFFLTYGITGCWIWKHDFGKTAVFIFDLFLFAMPCTMEYALQLRMYSWGMFFVTMCGMLAYDCYKEDKSIFWILLTLSATGAAYTHNFALVSVFFVYMLLGTTIIAGKRKIPVKWMFSGLGVLILYLPWLRVLLRQFGKIAGNEDYWIEPITKKTILTYFEWTFGNDFKYVSVVITLIFAGIGIYSLIRIKKQHAHEDVFSQMCWLVPFLTMDLGVAVSLLTTPVYYNRYVFCSLGVLYLGVGITLRDVNVKRPGAVAMTVFLLLIGTEQYRETFLQEYVYPGATDFTRFVAENIEEGDTVLYNYGTLKIIYDYYINDGLCYYTKADFSENKNQWYYIYTPGEPTFSEEELSDAGIECEYIKDAYIEEAKFQILRLYRK